MKIQIGDPELEELFEHGRFFHGHTCPAMPLGLRAGVLARRLLGVARARDKELHLLAETSEGHAMACFLDGAMTATGCTYGKGNARKLHYGKLAVTLLDMKAGRKVRVSVRPEFILEALERSPFLARRRAGVPPQEVDPALAEAAVNRIFAAPEEALFAAGAIGRFEPLPVKGCFEAHRCASCGEATFAKRLRVKEGAFVCIACAGYER